MGCAPTFTTSSLVGCEDPRDDVLELAAEVQVPRRVVQRLAGTIMWDRASPAATAVAEEIARDKALTEEICDEAETLVPRERVQQRTAEPIEDALQYPDETVEMVRSTPTERVQQRSAEQMVELRQSPGETATAERRAEGDVVVRVSNHMQNKKSWRKQQHIRPRG